MKPGKNTRHVSAGGSVFACCAHWPPPCDQPHEDQSQLDVLDSPTGLLPSCMPYLAAGAGAGTGNSAQCVDTATGTAG